MPRVLLLAFFVLALVGISTFFGNQQAFATSAVITNGAMPPPVSFQNSSGNAVYRVAEVNKTLIITRDFINPSDKEQYFVCFFEVRNSEGVTVFLEMRNGTAQPQQEFEVSVSWLPETKESFHIMTILVSDVTDPKLIGYSSWDPITIIDKPDPVSIAIMPNYAHLEDVRVVGKFASGYVNYRDPVAITLSTPELGAYMNKTAKIDDYGGFYAMFPAADIEIGQNTVSVSLPGVEGSMTNASFVYGHPILKGVLDNLKSFDLYFANNDTYRIKYQLVYGIVRDIVPQGSANYTIAFKTQMADEGAFVIQIPYSLLDKMTPLSDRDMIFFIDGNPVFPEQVIATREYGAFFAFIPPDTNEIIVAARLE